MLLDKYNSKINKIWITPGHVSDCKQLNDIFKENNLEWKIEKDAQFLNKITDVCVVIN